MGQIGASTLLLGFLIAIPATYSRILEHVSVCDATTEFQFMTWELERSLFSYVSVLRRINTILELRFAFVILILLSTLVFIFVLLFLSQQPSNNQRSDTLAHPMSVSSLAASRRRRVVCCRCWKTRFFEVINTLFGARPSSQVWRATGGPPRGVRPGLVR